MLEAYLVRVTPADLDAVAGDSEAIRRLIARIRRQNDCFLNLGEAWAGIHYVLTAEPPIPKQQVLQLGAFWDDSSLENVLMGGWPLPYCSFYGPARYLDSEMVELLEKKLAEVDRSTFEQWYDPEGLTVERIPPGDWDESRRNWLAEYFVKLVTFYTVSAAQGEGIIICLV